MPWRWHGYVSVFTASTHLHQLLELTAAPAEILAAWYDLHKTLRGCEVILNRTSPRPNGKVRLQVRAIDLSAVQLPQAPDLQRVLATLWNLPAATQAVSGLMKGHPQFRPDAQPTVPADHGLNRVSEILDGNGNGRCS